MGTETIESSVIRLGLAVWLADDYTGQPPIGSVRVTMGEKEAIRNPSGYYLFLDTPAGDYQVSVESQFYFHQDVDITLPFAGEPLESISLKPLPCYPFSASATLVRGMVSESGGAPVPGATVAITSRGLESQTTDGGEYVLYFQGLTEEDVIRFGNKNYVRNNGSRQLQLKVAHTGYKKKITLIEVEEGKTTPVSVILKKGG